MNNTEIPTGKPKKLKEKTIKVTPDDQGMWPDIEMPTDEAWKNEITPLNLSEVQEAELENVIRHVKVDIWEHNEKIKKYGSNSENRLKLREIETSLAGTLKVLNKYSEGMNKWMLNEVLERIGSLSSFIHMEEMIGLNRYSNAINREIEEAGKNGKYFSLQELEEKMLKQRETMGLKAGHQVLIYFLEAIHEPLKEWVEKDKKIGGPPIKTTQRLLIYQLAWNAPEIIGRQAPIAKKGQFVKLCAAVFNACGLSRLGIESFIPEISKEAREDRIRFDETSNGMFFETPKLS